MLKASQKKIKSFTNLLRQKLIDGGNHKKYVNSLSDPQILDDFRMCCDCGDELYSKDQQMHIVLEFDTAERAFEILYSPEAIEDLEPEAGDLSIDENYENYEEDIEDEDCENCEDCCDLRAIIENEEFEIIRGKWMMDGATTLDEAINHIDEFKKFLITLKEDGYELITPIEDDYGLIKKDDEKE